MQGRWPPNGRPAGPEIFPALAAPWGLWVNQSEILMRFFRPLLCLALAWLTVVIFLEAREEMKKEKSDGGKIVLYFGGVVRY